MDFSQKKSYVKVLVYRIKIAFEYKNKKYKFLFKTRMLQSIF